MISKFKCHYLISSIFESSTPPNVCEITQPKIQWLAEEGENRYAMDGQCFLKDYLQSNWIQD